MRASAVGSSPRCASTPSCMTASSPTSQIVPGELPQPRALPGSPDRVAAVGFLNNQTRAVLKSIRRALRSTGADKYAVLMGAMWDADINEVSLAGSSYVPHRVC